MGGDSWFDITLGEFVTLQRGHDLPEQDRRHGTVPILGSFGVTGWHDTAKAKGPGVTVGRSGASFGVVAFSAKDFWPLNTALYVIDFHGNDERFAYYFLKNFDFSDHNSGSAQPSLNRNYIHPLRVHIPPLAEQRAIAHILGTLDDKIELNRKMNETLEAMARALFKSWFVDFDPVRAKAAGRQPSGMDAETAKLFPSEFVESELGLIPRGWRVRPLRDLTSYLSRGIGPSYVDAGGVCVLNQKCVREHRIDFAKARRHNAAKKATDGRLVQDLDILINSTGVGTLGRIAQVQQPPEDTIVDSHVTVLRAARDIDPWFLGASLFERETEIEALGEGSTGQTELSRVRLGNLDGLVPPQALQRRFGEAVSAHLRQIVANEVQNYHVASARDALLPRLLSGELSVAHAERAVQDVA